MPGKQSLYLLHGAGLDGLGLVEITCSRWYFICEAGEVVGARCQDAGAETCLTAGRQAR